MRKGIRYFTAAIVVAVSVFGLVQPAAASSYVPDDESKIISWVNKTRAGKGLGSLARHSALVTMAREQADRMEAKGTIFHNTDLGGDITSHGLKWLRVGENVGMGPNVELIYDALLKSPKHYENIVRSEYDTIGVGVVAGDDGKRYVVQVFANLADAPAAAKPQVTAPTSTPATAEPAPVPATAAPKAQVATPKPRPADEPNALTRGYVRPLELPRI